jgi:hypothetical protein
MGAADFLDDDCDGEGAGPDADEDNDWMHTISCAGGFCVLLWQDSSQSYPVKVSIPDSGKKKTLRVVGATGRVGS